jgi:hypothetical protein
VGLGAVLYPTPSAGASISTLGDAGTSYAAYDAEYPYAGVGVLGWERTVGFACISPAGLGYS